MEAPKKGEIVLNASPSTPATMGKRRQPGSASSNDKGRKSRKYNFLQNANHDEFGNLIQMNEGSSRSNSITPSVRSMRSTASGTSKARPKSDNNNNIQLTPNLKSKPVFIKTNYQVLKNYLTPISFAAKPELKLMNRDEIQVVCASADDKNKLISMLKEKKLQFHTFTEPAEKPFIYVLKGVDDSYTLEEITKFVCEKNLQVIKTTFLINKPGKSIIHLVHFKRGDKTTMNLGFVQHRAKTIGDLKVRWERFDRSHKRISQCHNCQRFGHTASQCGHHRRCVKCLEEHEPQQCSRTSKEQEGSPKCVNCQGDHPANSPTCQHYISYRAKINKTRINRQNIQQTVSAHQNFRRNPLTQASPDPNLNSFSNIVRGGPNGSAPQTPQSVNDPFAKLNQLSARLTKVPNIHESIAKLESLVAQLESTPVDAHPQLLLAFALPKSFQNGY